MTRPSQADIYAALAAQSSSSFRKPAAPTAPYSAFPDPSSELITPSGSGPSRVNCTRVYCPREGCGSLILMDRAGEVLESDVEVLPYHTGSPFPPPNFPPSSPEKASATKLHYLYIPSPFHFENIGYSRPDKSMALPPGSPGLQGVPSGSGQSKGVEGNGKGKVKWLICAECDLGPVGWGFEGMEGGWVDMRRVRYPAPAAASAEKEKEE
ncbi:Mss4-like protein [Dioszegia hungarica]|uniref:Mss4-like protein n=1 Tax=Dioszegia hungarica TaxID=4972 RepID=A0AA38LTC1_9TREE|nr:Mss4-like protein [Dioszegia hungarica]KAI9633239.1 Mss4-like protein [Dioszegia hungarica]